MKKKIVVCFASFLSAAFIMGGCAGSGSQKSEKLDPKNPVTVTVWHYYNGAQLEAFDSLVDEFNDTVGKEKGVIVESSSQGTVTDLETSVLDSANHAVGAGEVPNIFAAYADTAYTIDQLGMVVNLADYLSAEEKELFIESYLSEGAFPDENSLKIFPIAKSTEIFMLNQTDWEKFASATNTDISQLETIEGVTQVAQKYYEWTDSLTMEPDDGKAFFGRDALANYMIIGSKQLGTEIFSTKNGTTSLNFSPETAKRLWDNYYVPYVKGYFNAAGRFRSDDVKTGNIIAFVGSSSGATYFPKEVILNDTKSYPIEMTVLPAPQFAGGEAVAVQQGAGMVVTKTENTGAREIQGSLEFLKWFVQDERNIGFSISSGYLPVTKSANNIETIEASMAAGQTVTKSIIETAINTVNHCELYTPKAFPNGTDARSILEYSMFDLAKADRETVLAGLSAGMSLEDATADFLSEDYFMQWYTAEKEALEHLVNGN